ncbi:phospholipase B [Pluteus cervinus]|uniref:Phospholipase B n=1 Tax=Pluteus cervinus TaxID=181527 RepID=A0ACD3BAY9_9AGAR|nr:phospholipase B [Pluteus cervinus]
MGHSRNLRRCSLFLNSLNVLSTRAQDNPSPGSVIDYAPSTNVECPDLSTTSLIRVFTPQNQTLHPAEEEYISNRTTLVLPGAWNDWLGDGSLLSYNLTMFEGFYPKVGIAIPGGGLRAAQFAAGCLSGIDARNDSAKAAGSGGLLQVASYISGLSGGSWITGSLFFNNWPNINELVLGNDRDLAGWKLDLPLVTPDGVNLFSNENQAFFGSVLWSVIAKGAAGIDTSMTDPWSRMISYHFLNQTTRANFFTNDSAHGAGQLWSDIPSLPAFRQYQAPFPIIVADSRPVGSNLTTILSPEPVVYEITPLELASYDPNLSAGVNLTYAGTHLVNGHPENGSACVVGFDQAGFVMGTSASLFNQLFDFARNEVDQFSDSDSAGLLYVLARQLRDVRTRAEDVANWPNPFQGLKNDTFEDSNSSWLELLDGSSNQENIPYGPLFVKARGLDVIVTVDGSSDDTNNWPNGTGLLFSASRQATILLSSHQQFPPIPQTPDDFIEMGLTSRPTFFGCNPVQIPPEYPLVIYLPNSPPISGDNPVTNSETFQLTYTIKHTKLLLQQAHTNTISGFTPNANIADPNWGLCLQCAAIDRARYKFNRTISRSAICSQCFEQYCFDPQNPPSKSELPNRKYLFVDPDPQGFTKLNNFFTENKSKLIGSLVGFVGFLAILTGGLLWWKWHQNSKANYQEITTFHRDENDALVWQHHLEYESFELQSH